MRDTIVGRGRGAEEQTVLEGFPALPRAGALPGVPGFTLDPDRSHSGKRVGKSLVWQRTLGSVKFVVVT